MKNLIASLALVFATGLTPAFANGINDGPGAEEVFAKQFAGAENVKWTKLNDGYLKATFTLSGIRAEAFFDGNAEFIGAVRNLLYSQLPLAVMQTISNKFETAAIIEVKEITNHEGTGYRVVLEQKNKKYKLKLNSHGEITEFQREKISAGSSGKK
jgi:hypothetical protein